MEFDWLFWFILVVIVFAAIATLVAIMMAFWPKHVKKRDNDILDKTLEELPVANRFYPHQRD